MPKDFRSLSIHKFTQSECFHDIGIALMFLHTRDTEHWLKQMACPGSTGCPRSGRDLGRPLGLRSSGPLHFPALPLAGRVCEGIWALAAWLTDGGKGLLPSALFRGSGVPRSPQGCLPVLPHLQPRLPAERPMWHHTC
ncbi:hypothetical protein HJG60_008063 [Phyllostomus discolor]|uniref:Uncharacterized protein n=1 Tax=Phyllostomus discolor TaxID=89673 RepID=A0A834BEH2_9CHIR|nr:hypothetical protein HJG60_008063 [Phyllostomus discolor]